MSFDHTKELRLFYISVSLYSFAFAIISLFIPLYLFGKGFSISLIFLFYAISQAGRLLSLPIAAYFSSIYGAKKMISARLDISRDRHHRKGNVLRVEINLRLPHKLLRAVAQEEQVESSFD
ncbi:hypothetical protein KJ854_05905, partial [Patescibacteria group bacterium]|nr:hypothetical protein [Patescibacteria group bacterium]